MTTTELIVLAGIGLLTGLVGGMLGVGGSIVMIPAMTEVLGPDQHRYQAAAMIVNFFVVVPAVIQHQRAGAIRIRTVARLVPLAVLATVAGVGISELALFAGPREVYLRLLFGGFLLYVATTDLWRAWRNRTAARPLANHQNGSPAENASLPWRVVAAVAVPTGLVAGLLGVGGGVLAVPLQRRLLHLKIRTAIANSASIIVATSLIGATFKNWAFMSEGAPGPAPYFLAAILAPTAVIGSLVGARLTHRISVRKVRAAFFCLLLLAAIRLLYEALAEAAWGGFHPPTHIGAREQRIRR